MTAADGPSLSLSTDSRAPLSREPRTVATATTTVVPVSSSFQGGEREGGREKVPLKLVPGTKITVAHNNTTKAAATIAAAAERRKEAKEGGREGGPPTTLPRMPVNPWKVCLRRDKRRCCKRRFLGRSEEAKFLAAIQ